MTKKRLELRVGRFFHLPARQNQQLATSAYTGAKRIDRRSVEKQNMIANLIGHRAEICETEYQSLSHHSSLFSNCICNVRFCSFQLVLREICDGSRQSDGIKPNTSADVCPCAILPSLHHQVAKCCSSHAPVRSFVESSPCRASSS